MLPKGGQNLSRYPERRGKVPHLSDRQCSQRVGNNCRRSVHVPLPGLSECRASLIGASFEEKALGQYGSGDVVDILGRHSGGEEALAPMAYYGHDLIDFRTSSSC